MSQRRAVIAIAAIIMAVVLGAFAFGNSAVSAHGTVVGGPYKSEGSTEHGHLNAAGTAVILNTFNQDWPGDHFCNLIVKGGPNGQIEIADPVSGQEYFTPGVNPAGQHYEVSHWFVSKCEAPLTTTTTVVEDTTTTVVEETTTTPVVEDTTTTVVEDTTTTAVVEETTTTAVEETTTTATPTTVNEPEETTTTANDQETTTTVADDTTTTAVVEDTTTTEPASVLSTIVEQPPTTPAQTASTTATPVADLNEVLPNTGGDPSILLKVGALAFVIGLIVMFIRRRPATS